jgi:hypothetical protein
LFLEPFLPTDLTKQLLDYFDPLDTYRPARQTQRLRPESAGRMRQFDDTRRRCDELVNLFFGYNQRRRCFQDHEIIPANLSQNPVIPEETHYEYLAKHGRMNAHECFKRNS